jgi:hypothetical protein
MQHNNSGQYRYGRTQSHEHDLYMRIAIDLKEHTVHLTLPQACPDACNMQNRNGSGKLGSLPK